MCLNFSNSLKLLIQYSKTYKKVMNFEKFMLDFLIDIYQYNNATECKLSSIFKNINNKFTV